MRTVTVACFLVCRGFGVLCVLCWDLYQLNWSKRRWDRGRDSQRGGGRGVEPERET